MANYETGHAQNVANFKKLISGITSLNSNFNPSKENIRLEALQSLLSKAKESIHAVYVSEAAYKNTVKAREESFSPFSKLITKVFNALKASDSSVGNDETALTMVRKLQGRRATPKKTEEEKQAAMTNGKEIVEKSASQLSYDSRIENFEKFIQFLSSVTAYKPNEEELKIANLSALLLNLKAKNSDVVKAGIALKNVRIERDTVLYKSETGLLDISLDVKSYLKSLFGPTDPQYKAISKLTFINRG